MNAHRLLALYDRVAEAPDAVSRLRRFVLDLAVRGKLVEQDPADEPASELLKTITAGKARMVRAGRVRRSRKLPNGDPVCRFGLPASWEWSAIESVAHIEMGQSPRSEHYNRVGNGLAFFQGKADFGPRHPTPRYWCTKPTKIAEPGDILLSIRAPVGPTNVADQQCCIGRGLAALRSLEGLNREFMLLALKAFESDLASLGFGTTFVAITKKQLTRYGFPLPPHAEQHRIVAKVDELMALCDDLEETRAEREDTRNRLTKASLTRLNTPDPDVLTFRSHARFAVGALPALTARADQVKRLRRTILNLAVRGKLVEQDPADEPASGLLKRIAAEKARLVKAGEIRKPSLLTPVVPAEQFFAVPKSWEWISSTYPAYGISDLGKKVKTKDVLASGTFPVVDQGKTFVRGYCNDPRKVVSVSGPLIVFGDHTRETKLIDFDFVVGADGVKILQPIGIDARFYHLALQWLPLKSRGYGRHFKMLKSSCIPLPPLAEQHRIVAKVDGLMAICDQLEASLAAIDGTRNRLLESLLHDALASDAHEPATAGRFEA